MSNPQPSSPVEEHDDQVKHDASDEGSDGEGDVKATATKTKKTGRPPLFAKAPKWKDIPSWFSRTDCPLLQLPDHILNRCFALDTGLSVRDYVALAGVNKFFRTQLDDKVFHEICIYHHLIPTERELKSGPLLSDMIVSRPVPEWYQPRNRKPLRSIQGSHYIPRGERQHWSKPQYKVYRQERDIHLASERLKRYQEGLDAAERRKQAVGEIESHPAVRDGKVLRQVIGIVAGLQNGEPAVKIGLDGPRGLVSRVDVNKVATVGRKTWDEAGQNALKQHHADLIQQATEPPKKDSETTDEDSYDEGSDSDGFKSRPKKRKRRVGRRRQWKVPETPTDSESDEFEWDVKGNYIIHDFWPSIFRVRAAESLKDARINKKTAKDSFKVSDGELLTLKHVLVHNPMNSTAPKRLFLKASVEALAYCSHGGPIGHREYVTKMNERSIKNRATRKNNIEKKKADGTYVPRTKRSTTPLHWTSGAHHPVDDV